MQKKVNSGIVNHESVKLASEKEAESGMVLALVLIMMSLAAAIVINSQVASRLMLRRAERQLASARLRVAATDAALGALLALEVEADLNVNHTNEAWSVSGRMVFRDGVEVFTIVLDEQRLFDVNNLSSTFTEDSDRRVPDIIAALLNKRGAADPAMLASCIRDWFLEDVAAGGEAKIMESPAELGRIASGENNPPDVGSLFAVLPYRRSRILPVNVNTAPAEVLAAVIGEAAAEAICGIRDAQPIMSLDMMESIVGAERTRSCRAYLDVKSRFFSVRARAALDGHEAEVYALARRDDEGRLEILRWVFR